MNELDAKGNLIPGYRLVRVLGSGDTGIVYLAMQRSLERQVAVKVIDAPGEAAWARFGQLLRTNARLDCPGIVDIQQIGRTTDGRLFYVMPFLLSLALARHRLGRKPLEVAALLRAVLDALDYAHGRGIVHGGIKPGNVLLDGRGNALLSDFGLARCATELDLPQPAAAPWISPEQARGQAPGRRSDLYSVGALAFHLLTGAPPFTGANPVATAVARIEQPVPRLPGPASAWQPWIDRALAKDPDDRFQDAAGMADALGAIDGRSQGATARTPVRLHHDRRVPAAIATAALLLVAIGGWAAWRQHVPAGDAPAPVASTPATPAVAGTHPVPAPAAPAHSAAAAASLQERVRVLVAQADTLRAGGHLFKPPGNSAAEQYLTALILDPGNPQATAGIDAMLATLQQQLDADWRAGKLPETLDLVKKCDLLATHAGTDAQRRWKAARGALARRVGAAVAAAAHDRDRAAVARLQPLAETLPAVLPSGTDLAAEARTAASPPRPVAGSVLQDPDGPPLVYVPADGDAPPLGAGRDEVTRGEYARFVQATHRPASRCLEAYNPFSRLRKLSWQSPGFTQGGNDPVVCVSWEDARAYAAWLSQRTGATYRLPTSAEWLRIAHGVPAGDACSLGNVDDASRKSVMDNDRFACNDGAAATAPVGGYAPSGVGAYDLYGNVSEWVAGGSSGARTFRGLSWRDGSQHKPLARKGDADGDVGYTNVGFRVVRAIDADHPAPPPARKGP